MNALRGFARVGTTTRACDMFMRAKAKDQQKGQKTAQKKTTKKPKTPYNDPSKRNAGMAKNTPTRGAAGFPPRPPSPV
eukprot:263214-Hanusia_phi.AAC.7